MDYVLGVYIFNVLQTKYPGGALQFEEDGGEIGFAPGTPPEFLVCHPDLPQDLMLHLRQVAEALGMLPRFVKLLNYDGGKCIAEARETLQENLDNILGGIKIQVYVNLGTLYNYIAPVAPITRDQAEKLVEKMREYIPQCFRTYVLYDGDKVLRMEYTLPDEPAMQVHRVAIHEPVRQTVINDDDLLNLRITLENAQSIDDILNSI